MKKSLTNKILKIKLILTDVDGVLTDGGRYYSINGENMKKFHTLDGMGVNLLLRNKIKTCIVTKENSKIMRRWAKDMNIFKIYANAIHKEEFLPKICKKFSLNSYNIAYIGDDVNDIDLLKLVGFSACPQGGIKQVKKNVDYVCQQYGGNGAFREIADLILHTQFPNQKKMY
jgi:YrbI family 3-deoxy-D-manno-octulosonate 8-phosphate phosphatase|tara:strand:- start:473 stop:988 length:516 start_codon:yes stop_codon:yes gene_type:complete